MLILKSEHKLSPEAVARIRAQLDAWSPDPVLVLDSGIRLYQRIGGTWAELGQSADDIPQALARERHEAVSRELIRRAADRLAMAGNFVLAGELRGHFGTEDAQHG